jgi:exodeoxyribonuclease VII small subunit
MASDKSSDDPTTAPGSMSYKEALGELETIVAELDRGVVDVDTLSQQFQRAIDLVEELDGRILKTSEQLDQLKPRLQSIVQSSTEEAT